MDIPSYFNDTTDDYGVTCLAQGWIPIAGFLLTYRNRHLVLETRYRTAGRAVLCKLVSHLTRRLVIICKTCLVTLMECDVKYAVATGCTKITDSWCWADGGLEMARGYEKRDSLLINYKSVKTVPPSVFGFQFITNVLHFISVTKW